MEGGSGKASVTSPTGFTVKDGKVTASVEWSSPYYDYMLIGDEKYEPVNKDGNSVFEIPVDGFDYPMEVVADTVAMSTPHEIEYTLQFDSEVSKRLKNKDEKKVTHVFMCGTDRIYDGDCTCFGSGG